LKNTALLLQNGETATLSFPDNAKRLKDACAITASGYNALRGSGRQCLQLSWVSIF